MHQIYYMHQISKKGLCVSEKRAVRFCENEKAFFSKGLLDFL